MRNPLDTLRPDVRAINAYVVQDATGMVKLDAMENPHRLPPALQAELGQRLGALALNRYPDGRVDTLRQVLAAHTGLPEGYGLILGNGSDEIINLLAIACNRPGATVLAPVPGFVMYGMAAQLLGLNFVGVPLTADFELDTPAMLAAVREHQPAIVYLAYPNNPTANLWDDDAIEQIIAAAPGLVVIDEAYQPFSSKTYLDRLTRHPHVLLMRTLSKFGLAGVRLGYLIGPQALVAEIDKVRPPYNVSVLNCECALFALAHLEEFAAQAQEIRAQRAIVSVALGVLPGVKVWPSDANMLLVRVPDAGKTFEGMKAQGVLVKNVSKMHPLLLNCVRITIGTAEENLRMLAAFQTTI